MPTFKLAANNKTYTLDTNGSFTESARTGSWSVLPDGGVEIRPAGGAPETAPAEWSFDANNHLVIGQQGGVVFDFTAADPKLEMELSSNVLQVWPDGPSNFKFELPFVWSAEVNFQTSGKLVATLNGKSSVVSGTADKIANRFVYLLKQKGAAAAAKTLKLDFVGTWKNSNDGSAGGVDVWFEYDLNGQTIKFTFPKGLWKIDPSNGTLYIAYGTGLGKQRIEINGEVRIGANGHLSLTFKRDVNGTTATNTLTFATKFDVGSQKNPAQLSLVIADATAAGGVRTVTVTGSFSYQSSNLGLTIGFTYKSSAGATVPRTVDLAVVLSAKVAQGTVSLTINTSGGVTTLDLKVADVKLSDSLSATLGLNVVVGGKQKSISGFLAFSW